MLIFSSGPSTTLRADPRNTHCAITSVPAYLTMEKLTHSRLLALPRELRDQVYHEVLLVDVDWDLRGAGHAHRPPVPPTTRCSLRVPWLNLRLACKQTNNELHAIMAEQKTKRHLAHTEAYSTHVLDVETNRWTLSTATWRRLPCPPEEAKGITVNINAVRAAWEYSGPGELLRSLWSILERTMWYGPRTTGPALPDHMHVQELIIRIDLGGVDTKKKASDYVKIATEIRGMCFLGLLHGCVDVVTVTDGTASRHFVPVSRKKLGLPE